MQQLSRSHGLGRAHFGYDDARRGEHGTRARIGVGDQDPVAAAAARLDDKAAGLLEFYDTRAAQALDARYQAEPWRELARESAAGKLSGEGFAATLVKLVGLALEISEDHASRCVFALDAAEKATVRAQVGANLQAAAEHAALVEKRVEALLAELAEWDNFQNVLTLARDILTRQKALRERTQQFATEK